jgi:formylglycine-generating enzyme required for sulfatase activity
MDKTEVTNAEYEQFVSEAKYRQPEHWKDGKPLPGQEKFPVTFVSLEDARAFAAWRSKRDGVEYRLPTEQEWEYAARNGSANNLYPWGDKWDESKAVLDEPSPRAVGSMPGGQNKWGVQDLIGNVWEWTSSEPAPYPGSNLDIKKTGTAQVMIRGGGAVSKPDGADAVTAARRAGLEIDKRNNLLGFRLVKVDK